MEDFEDYPEDDYEDDYYEEEEEVSEDYVKSRQNIIPVLNRDEMFEEMRRFNVEPHGISFCLGMVKDGEFTVHQRMHQPCYGEMRPYAEHESKPRDLHWPFPDGTPSAVSVNLWGYNPLMVKWYLTGETSPWRSLWKDRLEITYKSTGEISGFILTDTMFDPTYLVQSLVCLRMMNYSAEYFNRLANAGVDYLYSMMLQTSMSLQHVQSHKVNGLAYSMPDTVNFKRLRNSDPNLPEGFYFSNRAAYRRIGLEDIWWDESEDTTHLLNIPEFKALARKQVTPEFMKTEVIPILERISQ